MWLPLKKAPSLIAQYLSTQVYSHSYLTSQTLCSKIYFMTESRDVADIVNDDRITAFGLLVEANRRLQRTFDRTLRDEHAMSSVWYEALLRLGRSDGQQMSMSKLAEQMVLTSGGVTRLVDRLEEADYVERVACPTDRRVQWARLTDTGTQVLTTATRSHLRDLEEHFSSGISEEELAIFTRVLDRLRTENP